MSFTPGLARPAIQENRRFDLWVCLALGLLGIWQLAGVRTEPTVWTDQHCYTGLARSLSAGYGFTLYGKPHTIYPPGLPVVLAAFGKIFGNTGQVYISVSVICGIIGLFFAYLLIRNLESKMVGAAIAILVAGSSDYFRFATFHVPSELIFIACLYGSLLAILATDTASDAKRSDAKRYGWVLLASLLVASAVFVRTVGVVLVGALGCWLLASWRQPRKRILWAVFFTGALTALAWFSFGYLNHFATGSYVAQMAENTRSMAALPKRILRNLIEEGIVVGSFGSFYFRNDWYSPAWILPIGAVVAAFWPGILRRTFTLVDWFLLLWTGTFLFWFWTEGRLWLPVLPLLYLYCWRGLKTIWAANWSAHRILLAGGVAALLAAVPCIVYRFHFPAKHSAAECVFWVLAAIALFTLAPFGVRSSALKLSVARRLPAYAVYAALLAVFIGLGLNQQIAMARDKNQPDADWLTIGSLADWLKLNSKEGDGLMVEGDSSWYCDLSDLQRRAVYFPSGSDVNAIEKSIRMNDVRYVVSFETYDFKSTPRDGLAVLLVQRPQLLRLSYQNAGSKVFEVLR